MNSKETLRKILREKRAAISSARREEARVKIMQELLPLLAPYKHILSFASFQSEIDLWPLNELLCREHRLLLPRLESKKIAIYHVEDLSALIPSQMGILEPNPKCSSACPIQEIECALIPGLGFDSRRHRLGYGKGHIDQLLFELPQCMSIGVGFKEQKLEKEIPFEEHDQKLKRVVLV